MKSVWLFAILFSSLVWARSGGVVSNGADDTLAAQVWFLGQERIPVCYKVSKDYPLDADQIEEIIEKGFVTWKKFVENKKLRLEWPQDKPFLNFNYLLNASCQGNEGITFYFGVQDSKVNEALKQFRNAKAFTLLESYDQFKGRGKGFMWFDQKPHSPSLWSPYGQILSLVVHELGHVYGCDHVAGTIMREDIVSYMAKASPLTMLKEVAEEFPTAIEHARELYFSFDRGVAAFSPVIVDIKLVHRSIFKKLFNRDIKGPLWMGFEQGSRHASHLGKFYIADESGPKLPSPMVMGGFSVEHFGQHTVTRKLNGASFFIEFDKGSKIDFSSSDSRVFRSNWKGSVASYPVPGFLIQGSLPLEGKKGIIRERIPITYSRNRGNDEYVRLLFGAGTAEGSQEFFRAHLFTQPFW